MRLFRTIVLLMLVASLVPTAMVGWLSLSDMRKVLTHDVQELAKGHVNQLRLKTEAVLQESVRAVAGLVQVTDFSQLEPADQQMQLAAVMRQQPELRALAVLSAEGVPSPRLRAVKQGVPAADIEAFQLRAASLVPNAKRPLYSETYFSASAHGPLVAVAVPFLKPAQGYVAAEISLGRVLDVLEKARAGTPVSSYVVDRRGHLIAGRPSRASASADSDLSRTPVVSELLSSSAGSVPGDDGTQVGDFDSLVAAYVRIPETGWGVISEEPNALAYERIGAMERRMAFGAGAAFLVALSLAAFFSRKLTKPIKEFISASLQIAKGHFGVVVQVKGKSELGELAQNFNYMSGALQAYDQETKGLYDSVEKGYLETIVALAAAIDSKDPYTRGHSQRVGDVAVDIGRELGFTERQLRQLQYGGLLHDVGKIGISEGILRKGSQLTSEEMEIMRSHPVLGEAIIEPVGFLVPVRAASRNHHERWDGKGYPDGLKGEQIPLIARIVNCADTFDACTSTRPYQKAMPLTRAMEILEGLKGTQLDPKVVEALRRVVSKKGVRLEGHAELVKLAS